jgi:transcription termination factor Rho
MGILNRDELERSPLADLHAIASELGVEGFRRLRREELVLAIVEHAGAEDEPDGVDVEAGEDTGRRPRTGRRGGRRRAAEAEPPESAEEIDERSPAARRRGDGRAPAGAAAGDGSEAAEEPTETRTGVLDVLPNGSGFLRGEGLAPERGDVHVSPAQIRRCELRPGDEVTGLVRLPRRSERHPSLVRVEEVNGGPAEPPAERRRFEELTAAYATERLSVPDELAQTPIGKGSRVAVVDPQGAEGGALLRRLVAALRERHPELEAIMVLAGARPEDLTGWREVGTPVVGGSADGSTDDHTRAAELALERAKRVAERAGHALLAIDSLEAISPEAARRIFSAARRLEEAGTLTVVATLAASDELARLATTRLVLEAGTGARGDETPKVSPLSDTVRADLLGA